MSAHELIDRLKGAINSHDAIRVAACFSEDYRCEMPLHPSRSFTGSNHVLQNWTELFAKSSDLAARVLRSAANGEEIWSEWEIRGTARNGAPILMRGIVVFTTNHQQIAWTRFYLDPVTDNAPP
jgi:hypothetical protein